MWRFRGLSQGKCPCYCSRIWRGRQIHVCIWTFSFVAGSPCASRHLPPALLILVPLAGQKSSGEGGLRLASLCAPFLVPTHFFLLARFLLPSRFPTQVRLSHAGLSVLELSAALRHISERYKSQRHHHHKPTPYMNLTTSATGAGTGGRNTGSSNKGPGNSSNVHDNTSNNGNINNPSNNNTSSSQTTATASTREAQARETAAATPTAGQAPVCPSPQATGIPETPPNPGAPADTAKDRSNDPGLAEAPQKSATTTDTTATTTTRRTITTSEEAEDASTAHASSREVGAGVNTGAAAAAAAKQPPERGGKGAAALGEHGATISSPRAERTQRPAFGQQDWRALEPDLMQFCHKVCSLMSERVRVPSEARMSTRTRYTTRAWTHVLGIAEWCSVGSLFMWGKGRGEG